MNNKGLERSCSSYRDLVVWQRAIQLCHAIYSVTASFPREERFGLTSQMRRAAVSIPSNIAEGQGRLSTSEFRQFLGIARGSLRELETQLLIAADLEYLSKEASERCLSTMEEVSRMLNALITSISQSQAST